MLLQMVTYNHILGFSEKDHIVKFIFTFNISLYSYCK